MNIETEFSEFKGSILEYIAGLKEWQTQTVQYREKQQILLDRMLKEITDINLRCANRTGFYEQVKIHLKETDLQKTKKLDIISGRAFSLGLVIFTAIVSSIATVTINNLFKK